MLAIALVATTAWLSMAGVGAMLDPTRLLNALAAGLAFAAAVALEICL